MNDGSGEQQDQSFRRCSGKFGDVYLEDMVLGACDGIITCFAVIAAAAGGALGALVIIILGVANVLADAVSIGASNFLAKRSRGDFLRSQEVDNLPEEKKKELSEQIKERGVHESDSHRVVACLTLHKRAWVTALMAMGPGLQSVNGKAWIHALATLGAFVIAGAFPLIPYLFGVESYTFAIASATAAVTLFTAGALRTLITNVPWLRSGLEMLIVGSVAGVVAYVVGWAVSRIV